MRRCLFRCERKLRMNTERVMLDLTYYDPQKDIYSDGDIEEELLDIVKNDEVERALHSDNRWPILYHLSQERHNILSWFPFRECSNLLEIGSGCGAITGAFSDFNLNIECVESSKRRATIAAYRGKEIKNLTIHVGNFVDMDFNKKFDYITLIGVLEYAPMFFLGEKILLV